MHVGCPPGLSLAFDAEMTSEQQSTQYCQPDNDISCYYFDHGTFNVYFHDKVYMTISRVYICSSTFPDKTLVHVHIGNTGILLDITLMKTVSLFLAEFYPIFQIMDSVTEEHTIYKELYTLRAIAGGTGPTNMQYFNQSM